MTAMRANLGQQMSALVLRSAYHDATKRCCLCRVRRPRCWDSVCLGCRQRFWAMCTAQDECLGCDALSPEGSQWAWGIEDRGLCEDCAREWRAVGGELGDSVWGQ